MNKPSKFQQNKKLMSLAIGLVAVVGVLGSGAVGYAVGFDNGTQTKIEMRQALVEEFLRSIATEVEIPNRQEFASNILRPMFTAEGSHEYSSIGIVESVTLNQDGTLQLNVTLKSGSSRKVHTTSRTNFVGFESGFPEEDDVVFGIGRPTSDNELEAEYLKYIKN